MMVGLNDMRLAEIFSTLTYHEDHSCRCAFHGILKWHRDNEVSVDANHAQVEYGRCAQQDIEGCPGVADGLSEYPTTHDFIRRRKRHVKNCHKKVRHRQGHDQKVRRSAQLTHNADSSTNEQIAKYCADDDYSTDGAYQRRLPLYVRGQCHGTSCSRRRHVFVFVDAAGSSIIGLSECHC